MKNLTLLTLFNGNVQFHLRVNGAAHFDFAWSVKRICQRFPGRLSAKVKGRAIRVRMNVMRRAIVI